MGAGGNLSFKKHTRKSGIRVRKKGARLEGMGMWNLEERRKGRKLQRTRKGSAS